MITVKIITRMGLGRNINIFWLQDIGPVTLFLPQASRWRYLTIGHQIERGKGIKSEIRIMLCYGLSCMDHHSPYLSSISFVHPQ